MTDDEIHSALVRWVSTITGQTVIKDRQGVQRPALPYIMVDFGTSDGVHDNAADVTNVELETLNSEGFAEVQSTEIFETEFVFLAYGYGDGQSSVFRRIASASRSSQISEGLGDGVVLYDVGAINSIPEFIDNEWENRVQMNIIVRAMTGDSFVTDTIETSPPVDVERM